MHSSFGFNLKYVLMLEQMTTVFIIILENNTGSLPSDLNVENEANDCEYVHSLKVSPCNNLLMLPECFYSTPASVILLPEVTTHLQATSTCPCQDTVL